jgi:hypothetical protein
MLTHKMFGAEPVTSPRPEMYGTLGRSEPAQPVPVDSGRVHTTAFAHLKGTGINSISRGLIEIR